MRKHRKHRFKGQEQGEGLALWLNRGPKSPSRKRIARIISEIQGLDEQFRNDFHEAVSRKLGTDKAAIFTSALSASAPLPKRIIISQDDLDKMVTTNYVKKLRGIDRLLSRCWMRPRLLQHTTGVFGRDNGSRIRAGWLYANSAAEGAQLLISVAEIGLLDRVRQCHYEKCRAWLFAEQPKKIFCSPRCQTMSYQTSEEWKEHRRARDRATSFQRKKKRKK